MFVVSFLRPGVVWWKCSECARGHTKELSQVIAAAAAASPFKSSWEGEENKKKGSHLFLLEDLQQPDCVLWIKCNNKSKGKRYVYISCLLFFFWCHWFPSPAHHCMHQRNPGSIMNPRYSPINTTTDRLWVSPTVLGWYTKRFHLSSEGLISI